MESNIIKFVALEYHMVAAAPTMEYNELTVRPAGMTRRGNADAPAPPPTFKYGAVVYFHSEHPTFGSQVCQVPLIFVCGLQVGAPPSDPPPSDPPPSGPTPLASLTHLRPFPRR